MFWYDHSMGWLRYAGMGIAMAIFWALMIVGTIVLIRYISGGQQISAPPPSAAQILAARFARGEISETEYRDGLAALHDPSPR